MSIVGTRYVPETHAGSRDEIVRGLAAEAREISGSGYMRTHAKGRELERIAIALRDLGADLLGGTGDDEGYILIVADHLSGCRIDEGEDCRCPSISRFASPI